MKVRNPRIVTTALVAFALSGLAHGSYSTDNGARNGDGYASHGNYASNGGYGDSGAPDNGNGASGHDEEYGAPYGNGSTRLDLRAGRVGSFAVLLGGSEVSPEGKANAGDRNGRGTATVIAAPGAGKLCFAITVDNIDNPVAAHVHNAPAGKNGPIVVTLVAPGSGEPGAAGGCVSNLDSELLRAIQEQPAAFYVNVHTSAYPDGAVRGQLF